MKSIKYILLFSFFVVNAGFTNYSHKKATEYISIQDLYEKNIIDLNILSKGGYQEECIELEIENLQDTTVYVKVECGRRFISLDSTIQDIFIVKEIFLEILSHAKAKINGYGFCCQATNASPYKSAIFDVGFMAPESWIKIAEIINENDFPASVIQNAVWVLSDNHSLSSVHSDDLTSIFPLRKALAEYLNIEITWYTLTYAEDTTNLFSDRPTKIFGEINYNISNNTVITINIRNIHGEVVKTLVKESFVNPGIYKYVLELDVSNYPKGEYEVYFYEDFANLKFKKKFVL